MMDIDKRIIGEKASLMILPNLALVMDAPSPWDEKRMYSSRSL